MMEQRVFIATPAYSGTVPDPFAKSLTDSLKLLKDAGIKATWETRVGCCYLPPARNKLVRKFLETDYTDLFFLDADISWQPEAMLRLLGHDVDIVAGIYPFKQDKEEYPVGLVATTIGQPKIDLRTGLIQALGLPTGFMRIRRNVFDRWIEVFGDELIVEEWDSGEVRETYLCFFDTEKVGRLWYGEDYNFCRVWTQMGGTMWVDPDIDFIHYGAKEFKGNYHKWLMALPGGSDGEPLFDCPICKEKLKGTQEQVLIGNIWYHTNCADYATGKAPTLIRQAEGVPCH